MSDGLLPFKGLAWGAAAIAIGFAAFPTDSTFSFDALRTRSPSAIVMALQPGAAEFSTDYGERPFCEFNANRRERQRRSRPPKPAGATENAAG